MNVHLIFFANVFCCKHRLIIRSLSSWTVFNVFHLKEHRGDRHRWKLSSVNGNNILRFSWRRKKEIIIGQRLIMVLFINIERSFNFYSCTYSLFIAVYFHRFMTLHLLVVCTYLHTSNPACSPRDIMNRNRKLYILYLYNIPFAIDHLSE